jgi:hypothetical protein
VRWFSHGMLVGMGAAFVDTYGVAPATVRRLLGRVV